MTDDLRAGGRHDDWAPTAAGLVVLDVDGTLVGPDGGVTDAVVAAIGAAQEAGLHVGLATGRPYGGAAHVLARTGLRGPHVTANGAVVVHDGEILHAWEMDPTVVAAVLAEGVELGLHLELYTRDGYLVTDDDPRRQQHTDLLDLAPAGTIAPGDPLPPIVKFGAVVFDGDPAPAVDLLLAHGLTAEAGSSPATPGVWFVNATHADADKGAALLAAADRLGLDASATVAIGDGLNDLSMFAVAGTAVAMGQAGAELHDAAHLVTGPVTQDGVASALRAAVAGWDGVPSPT